MSQGGYVTIVGFVARDPYLRETKDGRHVAEVRVGTTTRVLDRNTGEWRDADTSYFSVSCWRRLADNVRASLRKGDPVVVKGRFKTRTYEDKTGQPRTVIEITADTVGHDLNRGVANYIRHRRPAAAEAGDPAAGTGSGPDASEASDMIDEEAIERFGRELEAELDDAALAARALEEDEEDEEDEAARAPEPAAGSEPRVSF
jgi:single-strand DNA-binding protein